MKIAKLVYVSLCTRVIVDENATDDEIIKKAKNNFKEKIEAQDFGDNVEDIENDEQCPYDPVLDK
jgi:hypothetical protein